MRDRVAAQDRAGPARRAAGGQCGPAQPAGPGRPARAPGRTAHPGARPSRRPGRDHLARRRGGDRHLRHRDRPLRRGPAVVSSFWSSTAPRPRPCAAAVEAKGYRCRADAPVVTTPAHPRGRGRRAVPRQRCARRGRSRSRTASVLLGCARRGHARSCTGSPTAPTWRRRWPRSRPWASGSSAATTAPSCCTAGRARLHQPARPLDCGNSGTSMRLLGGLVAGFAWADRAGRRRVALACGRWTGWPSRSAGWGRRSADSGERCLPPLRVDGWRAARHRLDVEDGQRAGEVGHPACRPVGRGRRPWSARRCTTRTHTEEMLAEAGADITVEPWGEGRVVTVRPSALKPVERTVPGRPVGRGILRRGRRSGPRQRGRRRPTCTAARPGSASSASYSAWVRDITLEPDGDRARAPRPSACARRSARSGRPTSRRRRSRRSTRSRSWPWRRPWPRDHGLLRRGRAPRQGGRPPGRRGRHGRGVRCHGPRSRATRSPSRRRRRACCAAPASTAGATTAWPWRPRSRRSRPHPASAAWSPASTRWRPATRASPTTSRPRRSAPGDERTPTVPRAAARRHRRPRRRRQVHGLDGRGRPPRPRAARYGSDVPRRGGARPRPRHRARRRRRRGRARRAAEIEVGSTGRSSTAST